MLHYNLSSNINIYRSEASLVYSKCLSKLGARLKKANVHGIGFIMELVKVIT